MARERSLHDYLPSRVWLMKSEPDVFSFEDLKKRPGQKEKWDGVRNYQARNFMMNEMRIGDIVLFYHSSCEEPGVAGEAEVVGLAEPDLTAQDPKSEYYDPKATRDNPRWYAVTVGKPKSYQQPVTLKKLRDEKSLAGMLVLRRGQRLSIQPVSADELAIIRKLSKSK